MPKMIPSVFPEKNRFNQDKKTKAEKMVYDALKAMPDTDDWTVLYSQMLSEHPTKAQGEVDFIVVIPRMATLIIEVKGGGIRREDGVWYTIDNGRVYYEIDPFQEANDACHAVIDFFKNMDDKAGKTLMGWGVLFPDAYVQFDHTITECAAEQLGDKIAFLNLKDYLLKLAAYWIRHNEVTKEHYKAQGKYYHFPSPNADACKQIVSLLRPAITGSIPLASKLALSSNRARVLTEDQFRVMEGILGNLRILVQGGAGTGKTTLAMKTAKTLAQSDPHYRIGLFCYNRKLAMHMKKRVADYPNIFCDSMTEYMDRVVQEYEDTSAYQRNDHYYRHIIPEKFTEDFILNDREPFDMIILDEGQDLMTNDLLPAMDAMLKGGLQRGRWVFFMDAQHQNIYNQNENAETIQQMLDSRGLYCSNYSLFKNCRNSSKIVRKLDEIFGIQTQLADLPSQDEEADVEIRQYRKEEEEIQGIRELLEKLSQRKITPDQITLLSINQFKKSVLAKMQDLPITEDFENRNGKYLFSTISSFKGLDSPVVILVDYDQHLANYQKSQLYVGMSRATAALYMFVKKQAFERIQAEK